MGDGAGGMLRQCTAADDENCLDDTAASLQTSDLMLNYIKMNLHATLWPTLYELFKKINDAIWKFVDVFAKAAKSSLLTAVGSIPFVGGMLAAVVGIVWDVVYKAIKLGVGTALSMIRKNLQIVIVETATETIKPTLKKMFDVADPSVRQAKFKEVVEEAAESEKSQLDGESKDVNNRAGRSERRNKAGADRAKSESECLGSEYAEDNEKENAAAAEEDDAEKNDDDDEEGEGRKKKGKGRKKGRR